MSTPNGLRPMECRTAPAESHVHTWGAATGTDDPRWKAALTRFAQAQRVFELAYRSARVSHTERGRAHQGRAEAFTALAHLAPLNTPVPFVTALFVAAVADAERARECERLAAGLSDAG